MKTPPQIPHEHPAPLPILPSWVRPNSAETIEDAGLISGAALAHMHILQNREDVPIPLLRARLALQSATVCVGFSGRVEQAGDLRDALHLLRPGDLPGPAGEVYQSWHRAIERPNSTSTVHRALPAIPADQITFWLSTSHINPVTRAALVLEAVLTQHPHWEYAALILSDVALSQALGWDYAIPLFANGIKRRDLRLTGDELRLACHRAITTAVIQTIPTLADLTRRAARLRAVAPKLRAKGAAKAVTMFLTQDAVAPTDLTMLMSDRAARRFCDRLIELGVARELTGRDSFRLYGL